MMMASSTVTRLTSGEPAERVTDARGTFSLPSVQPTQREKDIAIEFPALERDAALMAMKVTLDLTIPQIWSAQDSMITSADTIALVRLRTYSGKDTRDKPFAKYSTRPIYVEKTLPLEPRGGVQTERGMYFKGGYREYKMKKPTLYGRREESDSRGRPHSLRRSDE